MEWDKGNAHFPPTTFQISNIHSGTGARNVIPGHVEVLFNFRFSTALSTTQLQERTEYVLRKHDLQYDIEWNVSAHPFLTQHGKLIQATEHAIKEIVHLSTTLSTGGGTSDGRFIAPTGAEVVELGVSHATAHQVNECVNVEELKKLSRIYERILKHLFL
jgi:succinyl-diaminopimelate desuccinylase